MNSDLTGGKRRARITACSSAQAERLSLRPEGLRGLLAQGSLPPPGQSRLGWKTGMIDKVREARAAGVNQVVVFPKTPDNLKTETAEECFNPDGLAQRSISLLKDTFPDLEVYTDVALDPYNTMGHDGMVRSDGVVMNDETVYYLCKQAVSQARAGADVISPSDMMDGRVGAIREALDAEGFTNVAIMSYTAKCVTRPTPPLAFLRRF